MRRTVATMLAVAVALGALAGAAAAQGPPARITIVSVFDPITFGENAFVNGQLVGDDQGGQLVTLQAAPFPFTAWSDVAQATTDFAGYYSFKQRPAMTTHFRTVWNGQVTSDKEVQVTVAPRLSFSAGSAGNASVRFQGRLAPAHPGQSVAIQRRSRSGAWTTVVNARLHGGTSFAGRLRAHNQVRLRAFFASDGDHLDGFSRALRVTPGAHASAAIAAAASTCRAPVITRLAFKPMPPVAGRGATLRVYASLPGGHVYAVDVLWGEGQKRDHFTLAPALRKASIVIALRHRYAKAGRYELTVRAYGIRGGCKRGSRALRPRIQVVA